MKKSILCFAFSFACLSAVSSVANATCYHKIGALCKSGYASGFNSDCSTPCTTGLKDTTKHQHARNQKQYRRYVSNSPK